MRLVSSLRALAAVGLALAALFPAGVAHAGTTLDRVRARGYLQCASVERPGLAQVDAKNDWSGLEVETCRAVATAIFGPSARFAYHRLDSDKDFTSVRSGTDDLVFLTFSEMAAHRVADLLLPGPTVFVETHDVMVAVDSSARHLAELAGSSTCFIIGTAHEDNLDAWLAEAKIELTRFAFQEEGEMYDAYSVQRCKSVAGEATALAAARLDGGVNHLKSRLLPEHLAVFPIVAATPLGHDAQWAAIVAWTVHTLVAADRQETTYRPDGLKAMAVDGAGLSLAPGWQAKVVGTVGSYGAIFRRTLGADSSLKLEPGLNASTDAAGPLTSPHLD